MDKNDMVQIHNEIWLCHKKEQNNGICSNIDGTRDYHTKWSKSERERKIPYITSMWNVKHDSNELIYEKKQTHRHREQTCDCQGWGDLEKG